MQKLFGRAAAALQRALKPNVLNRAVGIRNPFAGVMSMFSRNKPSSRQKAAQVALTAAASGPGVLGIGKPAKERKVYTKYNPGGWLNPVKLLQGIVGCPRTYTPDPRKAPSQRGWRKYLAENRGIPHTQNWSNWERAHSDLPQFFPGETQEASE